MWVRLATALAMLVATSAPSAGQGLSSPYIWAQTDSPQTTALFQEMQRANVNTVDHAVGFVRGFVTRNISLANADNFWFTIHKPHEAIGRLQDHAAGEGPPLNVECYGSSRLILGLLNKIGVATRRVFLFSTREPALTSHSLFEYYSPERDRWEASDSLRDAHFVSRADGGRLDVHRILTEPLDSFRPCNARVCGWRHFPGFRSFIASFGAMAIDRYHEGEAFVFRYNPDRFAPDKELAPNGTLHSAAAEKPGTFLEIAARWWSDNGPATLAPFDMPSRSAPSTTAKN